MTKQKQLTPEQKVAIVRRHLVEKVPVSDLCGELDVHPNQYYNWQKQFFENGAAAFKRRPNKANEKRVFHKRCKQPKRFILFCATPCM